MKDKDLAMYLNELRKEALAHAIAAGFHDTYHSIEHYLCLVVSELMEAVEADRKDRHCTLDFDIDILFDIENKVAFQITFEDRVKDTVEDELADTVIRLLDFAGLTGLSIIRLVPIDIQKQEFTDWAFIAVRAVQRIADTKSTIIRKEFALSEAIGWIFSAAKWLKFDLIKHIELKMRYNSMRPHMHGKRY